MGEDLCFHCQKRGKVVTPTHLGRESGLYNEELHNLYFVKYYCGDQTDEDKIEACSTHGPM